ncbi:hypothetical protein C8R47DRAFT_143472 [Mycena vitilis]|nr:hypothetical protein C8R47DRAFT_143472 [Mycena vitilis]
MALELPLEIWDTVLECLPRRSLLIVRFVCFSLYDLSPRFLYSKFSYRPSAYTHDGVGGLVGRELDRLVFWSSAKIAPHVRTCLISYAGNVVMQSSSPIVNTLFKTVSCFSNLHTLLCNFTGYCAELPALRVQNLQHLQRIHIQGGPLSRRADSTAFTLSVHHFGYTDIYLPKQSDESPRTSCLSMLDSSALRSMELSAGHSLGLEHFLADTSVMASFHNLRTLSIAFSKTDLARIHASIAPFPAIEDLVLELREGCEVDTPLPPTPLAPHLCRYKGPAALLPLVLPGAQPTHLVVTDGSAAQLLDTLVRMRHDLKSITSLAIRIKLHAEICEGTALLELLALFPRLARLAIHVSSDPVGAVDPSEPHTAMHACERLANILTVPPGLRRVVFRWRFARSRDAEIVPDVSQFAGRLHSLNPSLDVEFSRLSAGVWGF